MSTKSNTKQSNQNKSKISYLSNIILILSIFFIGILGLGSSILTLVTFNELTNNFHKETITFSNKTFSYHFDDKDTIGISELYDENNNKIDLDALSTSNTIEENSTFDIYCSNSNITSGIYIESIPSTSSTIIKVIISSLFIILSIVMFILLIINSKKQKNSNSNLK